MSDLGRMFDGLSKPTAIQIGLGLIIALFGLIYWLREKLPPNGPYGGDGGDLGGGGWG